MNRLEIREYNKYKWFIISQNGNDSWTMDYESDTKRAILMHESKFNLKGESFHTQKVFKNVEYKGLRKLIVQYIQVHDRFACAKGNRYKPRKTRIDYLYEKISKERNK